MDDFINLLAFFLVLLTFSSMQHYNASSTTNSATAIFFQPDILRSFNIRSIFSNVRVLTENAKTGCSLLKMVAHLHSLF